MFNVVLMLQQYDIISRYALILFEISIFLLGGSSKYTDCDRMQYFENRAVPTSANRFLFCSYLNLKACSRRPSVVL